MAVKLQVRRGTTSEWTGTIGSSVILAAGELVWNSETNQLKVGNGVTNWSGLPGITGATGPGVADGGTSGQVLIKNGGNAYDTVWTSNYVKSVNGFTGDVAAATLTTLNTFTATNTFSNGLITQITSSTKGLVIKAPSSGAGANALEVQNGSGSPVFLMDYTGTIKSGSPNNSSLVVADAGSTGTTIIIIGASYSSNVLTFVTTGTVGLTSGATITFAGLANDFAFLNGQTKTMSYSGSGNSFTIPYTALTFSGITDATSLGYQVNYSGSTAAPFTAGQKVILSGFTDSNYNSSGILVTFVTGNAFVTSANFTVGSITGQNGTATQTFQTESTIPLWVSGTTYAIDALVYYQSVIYKRLTAGAGTTAPGADPTNWAAQTPATATVSAQVAPIQKWQTVGDPNASGVDSSGELYSKAIYTRDAYSSGYSTALTTTTGLLGSTNSSADLVSKSIGVYDTTGKNQIFGATTIGYVSGGTAVGTQYGWLQVYRQTSTASLTGAVLAVRGNAGTGYLQVWMQASSEVARLDYAGNLNLTGSATATLGFSTGSSISATGTSSTISVRGNTLRRQWINTISPTFSGGVWTFTFTVSNLSYAPTVSLIAVDSSRHIVLTLTTAPTIASNTVTVSFRAWDASLGQVINSGTLSVVYTATE